MSRVQPTPLYLDLGHIDPEDDDFTRRGYGDPVGDAGQLKVFRP